MYKDYLRDIDGVAIYPIISLLIFVIFFVLLAYFVLRADKKYINHMENLPLNSDEKDKHALELKTSNNQ